MRIVIDISWGRLVRWLIIAVVALGVIGAGTWCYLMFGNWTEVRLDTISPDGQARCEIVDVKEGLNWHAVVTVYGRDDHGQWRQLRQETGHADSAIIGDLAVDWQVDDQNRTQGVRVFKVAGTGDDPAIFMEVWLSP